MTRTRTALASFTLVAAVVITLAAALGFGPFSQDAPVSAQIRPGENNDQVARLNQVLNILTNDAGSETAEEAAQHTMELLMGGLRPLPTKGMLDETTAAHEKFNELENSAAATLEQFILQGRSEDQKGVALTAKLMLEEMNEVARVISEVTSQCGVGDMVLMPRSDNSNNPCAQLQPLLNEATGLEDEPVFSNNDIGFKPIDPLGPSYSVNLKSDLIPPRWSRDIPEHVEITGPLAPGECSVVFKEFRGLLLQLHLERITNVRDGSNSTGLSGTSSAPVWVLQWMPAQYGKQWSMCNTGNQNNPEVTTTVTRQVVEDEGLIYFWRFYD